jgi:hypothetical protein
VIFADSSVWIDHFRGTITPQVADLRRRLVSEVTPVGDLVVMEALRGIRDEFQSRRIRREMMGLVMYPMATTPIVLKSADYYRALRARGITIRSAIDCLIATFCIEGGHELLHSDRDFDPFERHFGLRVLRV